MYKLNRKVHTKSFVTHRSCVGKDVKVAMLMVDQSPAIVNHTNKFGWPMTDIQLLMACNDDMERQALASRLQQLDMRQDPAYAKLSDEEKILLLKPNWVQTPAEIERFTVQQTELLQYKVELEKAAKLSKSESTTTTDETPPDVVNNPE